MNECMSEWNEMEWNAMNERTNCVDGWMERWTEGRTEGRTNKRTLSVQKARRSDSWFWDYFIGYVVLQFLFWLR